LKVIGDGTEGDGEGAALKVISDGEGAVVKAMELKVMERA